MLPVFGQTSEGRIAFDVASVKTASLPTPDARGMLTMQRTTGGPGSNDPGRIHYPYISLKTLLQTAYQVKNYQIEGPDWLDAERFDITATMPPTTTKEQFSIMLQSLLADRFRLVLHRATKDGPMYSLVLAKGGPKLKESGDTPPPASDAAPPSSDPLVLRQTKPGADGLPPISFPPGKGGLMSVMTNGHARLVGQLRTMNELAEFLTGFLNCPVTDSTGLTSKYDFTVNFAASLNAPDPMAADNAARNSATPEQSDVQPGFFAAIQSQLGLRLESKKGPIESIIIDHIERKPTVN
jgi:uncharacterized protein (TIGR03435 family)